MKIRNRLTLTFGLTVSIILILFGLALDYFSSRYRKSEFYQRLAQRVDITEKMFLERQNLSPEMSELIREQFLNKLPEETEEVVGMSEVGDMAGKYPRPFLESLLVSELAFFDQDTLQGVGKVFHLDGGDYAVILTARDMVGIRMVGYLRTIILLTLVAGITISVFIGYYISGRILNPIVGTIHKANAISASNLHERLTVYDSDNELGQLSIAFNNLLDRVNRAFEAQVSFVNSASHEIRNPLTAIIGEADVALEKRRSESEYVDSLSSISTEADRLKKLVDNLLQLASINDREVKFKAEGLEIGALLFETKRKFDFLCPDNLVKFEFSQGAAVSGTLINGNGQLLQTALLNFLDNARKFSYNKPVSVDLAGKGNKVCILVRDSGIGIPAEDIPKLTRPFHRASNVRRIEGAGIGIPLASKIIEMHHGSIEFESELEKGTLVTITLPVLRA